MRSKPNWMHRSCADTVDVRRAVRPGLIVGFVGLGLLTSCQAGRTTLADMAPTAVPAQQASVTGAERQQRQGSAWWKRFNDPVLNDVILRVEAGNFTVAQARERLVAATALSHSATTAYRPGLGMTGSAAASTSKIKTEDIQRRPAQINLETGWEIALFGEDKMARQSADMDAAIAAEDVEAARLAVAAEAATSYVRLRALQQSRRDADLGAAAQAKASAVARTLSQNGLGTKLDALQSDGEAAAAAQRKRVIDNAIADEIQRLAILQGLGAADAQLAAVRPQPALSFASDLRVPADVLRRRADVRRAEFTVLKAAAELGIAKADLYPKLHFSGVIGFGTPVSGNLFGVMGGPSLQLPIFDQGKRRDVITARQAQWREAANAYKETALVAYSEASQAMRLLMAAKEATAQARTAQSTAQKALAAAELLQREGLVDASKVAERQIGVVERRRQVTEATQNEAEAFIAFVKASGGTIDTDGARGGALSVKQTGR